MQCDNPKLPDDLKRIIDTGIKQFLAEAPDCADAVFSFGDTKTILLTTIQEDHIVSSKCFNEHFAEEVHEGIVLYEGRNYLYKSEFRYCPSALIGANTVLYEVWLLPDKKHQGHALDLVSACEDLKKWESESIKREKFESEMRGWAEYYEANKDAFLEWFAPLLDSPRACPKVKLALQVRAPFKKDLISFDHGRCDLCINFCKLIENSIPWGEHSPQWYELGVDDHCPEFPL